MSDKWKYDAKEKHSALYITLCKPHGFCQWQQGEQGILGILHAAHSKKVLISFDLQHLINFKQFKNATLTPFHCSTFSIDSFGFAHNQQGPLLTTYPLEYTGATCLTLRNRLLKRIFQGVLNGRTSLREKALVNLSVTWGH